MLLEILLILGIIMICVILWETNVLRMVLWLGLYSLVAALTFFVMGAPDVAMAEGAISGFSTIFFIVCFEKYFILRDKNIAKEEENIIKRSNKFISFGLPLLLAVALAGLFIYFLPESYHNPYVKDQYIRYAGQHVGGENVVGAIILGYRVYDTLFEALMLVVAVVAVIHMSEFNDSSLKEGKKSGIEKDGVALFLMRIVAPVSIVFGVYLIANGFLTAGGGFQGGLAVAAFFICRYMVYDIYDISMKKVNKMEEIVFAAIALIAILIVFQDTQSLVPYQWQPAFQSAYLILMNSLVGLKVACGFLILFYRYIAIERN